MTAAGMSRRPTIRTATPGFPAVFPMAPAVVLAGVGRERIIAGIRVLTVRIALSLNAHLTNTAAMMGIATRTVVMARNATPLRVVVRTGTATAEVLGQQVLVVPRAATA